MNIIDSIAKYMQIYGISQNDKIAVAVSGGSDSLGLALILSKCVVPDNIHAITIDHGLRQESSREALQVKGWLEVRQLKHITIEWLSPNKNLGNMMQNARNARYKLLNDYCQQQHIKYLFIAHTLDDQLETFFIGLERGSGIDGISGMSDIKNIEGINICRPLLKNTREEIRNYLNSESQQWVDDPSNDNENYLRVRIRKIFQSNALFYQRINLAIDNIKRSSNFIKQYTETIFAKIANQEYPGVIYLDLDSYQNEMEEIRFRLLNMIISKLAGTTNKQRLSSIKLIDDEIMTGSCKGRTIKNLGILIKEQKIFFYRLKQQVAKKVLPVNETIYFADYKIECFNLPASLAIGFPSNSDLAKYKKLKRKLHDFIPNVIIQNCLVVYELENILFIPHISCGDSAEYGDFVKIMVVLN